MPSNGAWTPERVREILDFDDRFVGRCLVILWSRQTSTEQATRTTRELNGRGFNGRDAEFGSSLAVWFQREGFLTWKQLPHGRRIVYKYAAQLASALNAEESRTLQPA